MDKMDICMAIDGVDDELLERSEKANGRSVSLKHRIIAAVCAACLALALMGAAAINHWDDIQKWIAYRWEDSTGTELSGYQLEAVERLSQEIGVSQTVNGVTVTVDSAALFGNELQGILCVEGLEFESGNVAVGEVRFLMNGTYCSGTAMSFIDDNGLLVIPFDTIGDIYSGETSVAIKMELQNFTYISTEEVLHSGPWKLEFEVKNESVEIVELPDAGVTAKYLRFVDDQPEYGEMPITIRDVELSNYGLKFNYEYEHGGVWDEEKKYSVSEKGIIFMDHERFVYTVMKDGTEVYADFCHESGTPREVTDPIQHMTCYISWPAPINVNEVVEVHIGDAVIPVK